MDNGVCFIERTHTLPNRSPLGYHLDTEKSRGMGPQPEHSSSISKHIASFESRCNKFQSEVLFKDTVPWKNKTPVNDRL